MVVPSNSDGFRAVVSALRSLDWKDGVSLPSFNLTEDRIARLLVKNIGRVMPESVVRQELESLNIRVQGVTQLRTGRCDQDPGKDRPPTTLFNTSVVPGPGCQKCNHSTNTVASECR